MSATDEDDTTVDRAVAGDTAPDPSAVDDPAELRRQIEETRGELGDTVEALSHELDVKARVKESVQERKEAVGEGVQHAKETVATAATAAKDRLTTAAQTAQEHAGAAATGTDGTAAEARRQAEDGGRAADRAGGLAQDPRAIAIAAGVVLVFVLWRRRSA